MDDALSLAGRTAIVTGAGNGLGRAEALALAAAGARLVLNDLAADDVHAVAAEIVAGGGQAVAIPADIGEWATGQQLVAAALDSYGRLDILVNNAGVLRDRMVFTMSADEWDLVLRVHLRGHFVTTRFATAHWREASKQAGAPVYGRIVNTSSEAFLLGSAGAAQLRRGQGRDRRADGDHRAQLRQVRGACQCHLPAGPHRDDRGPDGRRAG